MTPNAGPYLTQTFTQKLSQACPPGLDQLFLHSLGLSELRYLETKIERWCWQLGKAWRQDRSETGSVGGRLSESNDTPPRASSDEASGKDKLAGRPTRSLRSCEQGIEQANERVLEAKRVCDCLGELNCISDVRRRTAWNNSGTIFRAGEEPGILAIGPEAISDGGSWQGCEFSKAANAERRELVASLGRER